MNNSLTVSTTKSSYSDFWLNKESLHNYVPTEDLGDGFSIDLIKLAAYRRIVSNFVFILTHLDIPVQFNSVDNSNLSFTDGNTIYLSASITHKEDFDWSVGIALHEASHILLTDFDVVRSTFSKIPIPIPLSLKRKSKDKNLNEEQIAKLCKWIWNYIEDRYIDNYIFEDAPGYRGYYKAIYDKFWNSEVNSKALTSRAFRVPNLLSYEFRVINLTNKDTDLDALPGLKDIATAIDLTNIFRLDTTSKRMDLSYQVAEIIIDNLISQEALKPSSNDTIQKIHEKLSEKNGKTPTNKFQKLKGDDIKTEKEELDEESGGKKSSAPDTAGDISEFSDDELNDLGKQINKQRDVLDHNYDQIKSGVTKEQQSILEAIENSDMQLVPTGYGLMGDYTQAAVDAVVVNKLSKKLIDSGSHIFPLAAKNKLAPGSTDAPLLRNEDAVNKGFVLGKLLGRKLQIRGEETITKYIRKQSGKIERRLLAEIGAGIESIFSRTKIQRYNKIRLHISVDSSASMEPQNKWCPTMTCVVAICVAASMTNNLDVSVSFRSTIFNRQNSGELPYVVLAYDSKTDNISKIRHLFPYLNPNGATPEGLAFESIAEKFIIGKQSIDQQHYFLNISDGEPAYHLNSRCNRYKAELDYMGEIGSLHTKYQVDKIRRRGVKILSYFIKSDSTSMVYNMNLHQVGVSKNRQLTLKQLFDMMYGNDAQFIDVENVTDIARTINKLFLSKET